jgi:hypothetical protein
VTLCVGHRSAEFKVPNSVEVIGVITFFDSSFQLFAVDIDEIEANHSIHNQLISYKSTLFYGVLRFLCGLKN